MSSLIFRSIAEPLRTSLDWSSIWEDEDRGTIKTWETGRALALQDDVLVAKALANELPPLNWKGGIAKKLKKAEKFGSLRYLAQWQGLRGEDLRIDMDAEVTLTCSRTEMVVTFTPNLSKLSNQDTEENEEGHSDGRSSSGISEQSLFS